MRVSPRPPDWTFEERCGNMHTAGYATVCANPEGKMGMHKKLTSAFLKTVTEDDTYGDGGNLSLGGPIRRSFQILAASLEAGGDDRSMFIGPFPDIPAEEAREKARQFRNELRDGRDPWKEREKARIDRDIAKERAKTLKQVWHEYFHSHLAHGAATSIRTAQNQMENHVLPKIGEWLIEQIDIKIIIKHCLEKLWTEHKPTGKAVIRHLRYSTLQSTKGTRPATIPPHGPLISSTIYRQANIQPRTSRPCRTRTSPASSPRCEPATTLWRGWSSLSPAQVCA
jgi:hypothetical protein